MSVLKISEAVALGIHACLLLSQHKHNKLSVVEMADALDASKNHLSKVMQRLTKAGIVNSGRGPAGGFCLSKTGDDITLFEIYEALDGPFPSEKCLFKKPVCDHDCCPMKHFLTKINNDVNDYFQKTTLFTLNTEQ